jgi:hypothetical protein
MRRRLPADHPVLTRLPELLDHARRCGEERMVRMGLVARPLSSYGRLRKAAWLAEAYAAKLPGALWSLATLPLRLVAAPFRRKRLTDTYLGDPHLQRGDDAAPSTPTPADDPIGPRGEGARASEPGGQAA